MRLFFYTDEPLVSEALTSLCARAGDIHLEKTIETAEEIVPVARDGNPDLFLLSLTPELHFGILDQLHQTVPQCRTVLWARSFSFEFAHQAIELGVRGILKRTCSPELLVKCLRKVYAGEAWFDREITARHLHCHRVLLTPRQAQLAQLVAEGLKNREIAENLSISEGAVKVYLSHLLGKLGIEDRAELARLVARNVAERHDELMNLRDDDVVHALYVEASEEDQSSEGSPASTSQPKD